MTIKLKLNVSVTDVAEKIAEFGKIRVLAAETIVTATEIAITDAVIIEIVFSISRFSLTDAAEEMIAAAAAKTAKENATETENVIENAIANAIEIETETADVIIK